MIHICNAAIGIRIVETPFPELRARDVTYHIVFMKRLGNECFKMQHYMEASCCYGICMCPLWI